MDPLQACSSPLPLPSRGVYIHWPFCKSKCPYCDFNSHVRAHIDLDAWRRAYGKALEQAAALVADAPVVPVESIFFGGGTPSLMPAELVGEVIATVKSLFFTTPDLEITLEANPNSAEVSHFEALAKAGVNRVSIGIQALNNEDLQALGRQHSAEEGRAAIAHAAAVFPRYSFDLIYARGGQTLDAWRAELETALTLAGHHLSLYQLTIEPGTVFHHRFQNGHLDILDEDTSVQMFELTQQTMSAAGMPGYEISNHARPGQECRHNLIYWRGQEYIGVGPGAHGRVMVQGVRTATRQHRAPEVWLERVAACTATELTPLGPEETFTETLMMGLRLAEGISRSRLDADMWAQQISTTRWKMLLDQGYAWENAERLGLTPPGRQRLNAVLSYVRETSRP